MKLFVPLVVLVLSGCVAGNVSLEAALLTEHVTVTPDQVLTTGPTLEISATDCKRVIEGNAPTAVIALDRLRAEAAQNGFNAIHSVVVKDTGAAALLSNCWSQVRASGVAYTNR